jgi:hypothetical protein
MNATFALHPFEQELGALTEDREGRKHQRGRDVLETSTPLQA